MDEKLDPDKKLLHQRYRKTDICAFCYKILADWEFEERCPERQKKTQPPGKNGVNR